MSRDSRASLHIRPGYDSQELELEEDLHLLELTPVLLELDQDILVLIILVRVEVVDLVLVHQEVVVLVDQVLL